MEIINYFIVFMIGVFFALIVFFNRAIIEDKKPKNKVRFYVAREKNGTLWLYMGKPIKKEHFYVICNYGIIIASVDRFSGYGLDKNDYANLKWEDDPVEVFINMED